MRSLNILITKRFEYLQIYSQNMITNNNTCYLKPQTRILSTACKYILNKPNVVFSFYYIHLKINKACML